MERRTISKKAERRIEKLPKQLRTALRGDLKAAVEMRLALMEKVALRLQTP